MKFINESNQVLDTDMIGTDGSGIYYSVLDFSRPKSPDYLCKPLVFVETYTDTAAQLKIGPYEVILPFKWSIMICNLDTVEYMTVEDLAGQDIDAFCFNPWGGYMPNRYPIKVELIYRTATWTCPLLDKDNLLVIPIGQERDTSGKPREYHTCIMAGEPNCRVPESVDMSSLW